MVSIKEQIQEIEEEIRSTPYNKATQHHIGKLKAKLAKLQDELDKQKSKGPPSEGFGVKKSGHATVVIVGLPSVGKSTLLNAITDAESEVAPYDFTTLNVIPGVMVYKGAKIQVLDLPGLVKGAAKGKGRGKEVLSVVRSADLILLMVDVFNVNLELILDELYKGHIRLNQHPSDIVIKRKDRGGINVTSTTKLTKLSTDTISAMMREYGIINADVILRSDVTEDQVVDFMSGNRIYVPAFVVLNKIDLVGRKYLKEVQDMFMDITILPISAQKGFRIEDLKLKIFETLKLIRIYMRPQGGPIDYDEPLVIREGSNVGDVCDIIHRGFRDRFRYANIWGKSAKFSGQTVGLRHILMDEDVLTIVVSK